MKDKQAQPEDEGSRSFARFIEQLADGRACNDLSYELHRLMVLLREDAGTAQDGASKGDLGVTIHFKVEATGVVGISYSIKAKEPQARRPNSVFWLTRGGNLTAENPRQQELPNIREVTSKREQRDLPGAAEGGVTT